MDSPSDILNVLDADGGTSTADFGGSAGVYDDLARDPTSEKEFGAIIDETFVQVKGALTAYPAETREEALAGTLRGGSFKDTSVSFIRHRGVREDLDSRDYFLELGRWVLPEVAQQIEVVL